MFPEYGYTWRTSAVGSSASDLVREVAAGEGKVISLGKALLTCLALAWLNPHVYLDTVVLLGTISTRFPGLEASFAAGAVSASFLFFFSLGYGATKLRPFFANPAAWHVLEGIVAVTMWLIALKLATGL